MFVATDDSPLNMVGQEQASELRNYLAKDSQWPKGAIQAADLKLLKGTDTETPAIVVSSTLRRAVVRAKLQPQCRRYSGPSPSPSPGDGRPIHAWR